VIVAVVTWTSRQALNQKVWFAHQLRQGKQMIRYLLIVGVLMAVTQVNAQVPAPAPKPRLAPPTSAYCLPASVAFLESDAKASDEVQKCARGDTVVIPSRNASAVARMCDFSKAIVSLNDNVVCVLIIPERISK